MKDSRNFAYSVLIVSGFQYLNQNTFYDKKQVKVEGVFLVDIQKCLNNYNKLYKLPSKLNFCNICMDIKI